MLLTLQLKLKIKKDHTPSITTVTITVYLKENGNKKKKRENKRNCQSKLSNTFIDLTKYNIIVNALKVKNKSFFLSDIKLEWFASDKHSSLVGLIISY